MENTLFENCRENFYRDGFVMMRNVISSKELNHLRQELDLWTEESKSFTDSFGQTIDGRARFDVEPATHSKISPALRRVSSPIEISERYLSFTRDNIALDLTAYIFGPNIKLVNTKINLKLPGSGTDVKYHQDFPFEPHSNDDLMTTLYFLDDVTLENGPLEVVPGSHTREIFSLWHGGEFTGSVSQAVEKKAKSRAVKCVGKAGDVCLMHTRVLHGSAPNTTNKPRRLFIACYASEDAIALDKNHIPHKYDGEIVRGIATGRVRTSAFDMELPEYPKQASFFSQQSKN